MWSLAVGVAIGLTSIKVEALALFSTWYVIFSTWYVIHFAACVSRQLMPTSSSGYSQGTPLCLAM